MEKIIGKAKCRKLWTDGYFTFEVGEEVDLTEGYEEEYALLTPFGSIDIEINDGHWELLNKINN